MPQFFSSAPVDFGAQHIADGWSSAANSIAGAVNQITKQKEDERLLRVRDSLQANRQKAAAEQDFLDTLAMRGVAPIRNPDGSLNRVASGAALAKAESAARVAQERASASTQNQAALEREAMLNGWRPDGQQNQSGPVPPTAIPADFFEKVRASKAKESLQGASELARVRAEAGADVQDRRAAAKDVRDYRVFTGQDPAGDVLTAEEYSKLNTVTTMTPTSFDVLGRPVSYIRTKVAGGSAPMAAPAAPSFNAPAPLRQATPAQPNTPSAPSGQDAIALEWAKANPADPRSAAILRKLGLTK